MYVWVQDSLGTCQNDQMFATQVQSWKDDDQPDGTVIIMEHLMTAVSAAVNQLLIADSLAPPSTITDTWAAHQPGWCLCECIVIGFHPALQLMPLKRHPVTSCHICLQIPSQYCLPTLHILLP